MTTIPSDFTQTTTEVHGAVGAAWLERLPDLLADCAARWSMTLQAPFAPLTYNYVAPAVRADGTPAVLKAGVPGRELSTEVAALRCFDGQGAVRLLDADDGQGVLLLERLTPGASLLSVAEDEQAARIAADVMRGLWRPAPAGYVFPTVAEWASDLGRLRKRFGGGTGPLPPRLIETAETLLRDLVGSATETRLLHGDLHHGNILDAGRAPWLAIDPKGVVGEPAFEAGAFLLNPHPQMASTLTRRVDVFADALGIPKERVRAWGVARAMLSAWWSLEDHGGGWEAAIAVAEALSAESA